MTTEPTTRREIAAYSPVVPREALLAQAIGCILSGRPYPESLRAPSDDRGRPASVEEGLRWLMADPSPVSAPS